MKNKTLALLATCTLVFAGFGISSVLDVASFTVKLIMLVVGLGVFYTVVLDALDNKDKNKDV